MAGLSKVTTWAWFRARRSLRAILAFVNAEGVLAMITDMTVRQGLESALHEAPELGKFHLSVRYEPGPSIVRAGVCIENYTWDTRMLVIDRVLAFEREHADDFAIEFDVVPLEAVNDEHFAEA